MNSVVFIFLFYFIFVSATLIYGIGLKQCVINSATVSFFSAYVLKNILLVFVSAFLCRFLLMLLSVIRLAEILPVFILITVFVFSNLFSKITGQKSKENIGEMLIIVLCVLLTVSESVNFMQLAVIAFATSLSVFFTILILYAIQMRIRFLQTAKTELQKGLLIFLSIGFMLLSVFGWNFSWLTVEIFK